MDIKPLDVTINRCVIDGKMLDIVDYERFASDPSTHNSSIGILENYEGRQIVLPYKGKDNPEVKTTTPGVYDAGCIDFVIHPSDEDLDKYTPEEIIDFNNHDSMKDILEKEETLSKLNEPWITSPDNITQFPISDNDRPEMICLKSALNAKKIDFDRYSDRFGDNYPNDKRQLKNNGATLNIIKRFCDKCDMEALLILRDKNPNVPNPMGVEICVSLTDDGVDCD